jgi:hypothetical protein
MIILNKNKELTLVCKNNRGYALTTQWQCVVKEKGYLCIGKECDAPRMCDSKLANPEGVITIVYFIWLCGRVRAKQYVSV